MRLIITCLIIFCASISWSQDGTKVLSYQDYSSIVKSWHPLALQAEMQTDLGQSAVKQSKGINDPQLIGGLSQKEFDNKNYYQLLNAGLKVPTWYGISFQGGVEQNSGEFINPENTTPINGQIYAGVELNLGNGLLMNQRKAAFEQAELFHLQTEEMQKLMLNQLLLESGKAYWDWNQSYNNLKVYEDALNVANQRFSAVWEDAKQGERPYIDTLESGIQYQTRIIQHQQALLEYKNARAKVEVFLWKEGQVPLVMEPFLVPGGNQTFINLEQDSIQKLISEHPELKSARFDLQKEEVKLQLTREKFKPDLNIKYNLLTPRDNFQMDNLDFNSYSLGVEFKMPIFVREARGASKMSKVKIEQKALSISQKEMNLKYKVQVSINELVTYKRNITTLEKTVSDYNQLLGGERSLFEAGESSLFMVNSREMSYIQSQLKLNESIAKMNKAELMIRYALGVLYLN